MQALFAYPQYGRLPEDWRCRAMPLALFHLGLALWQVAKPFLGPYSQRHPPVACQLMLYYGLFGSSIGRHRDYFTADQAVRALVDGEDVLTNATGHAASSDDHSRAPTPQGPQVPGSDVLVWTEGNLDMNLCLSFPRSLLEEDVRDKDRYIKHPNFTVRCTHGTLFVFNHLDDLHFCHEAEPCDSSGSELWEGGCRFAYVFRCLSTVQLFHASSSHNMRLSDEQVSAEVERMRKKRKQKREGQRRRFY